MTELLAPAGSLEKLYTPVHFGADAVYLSGKKFGLRAYAGNFENDELIKAAEYLHGKGKRMYVTLNIFADNADFGELDEYLQVLESAKADAVIVTDAGLINQIRKRSGLNLHLSTQANTTNKYAAEFWRDAGIKRVVLARELSIQKIREISEYLCGSMELEAFVHGAMCIAYSGRCLLSSYLTGRDGNRGECVQACRWKYEITDTDTGEKHLGLSEDGRGTYILNSKDLCTISFLEKLIDAGISSFKIEGRMKSEYYVGTVVNAYRRRLNDIAKGLPYDEGYYSELCKAGHREYTEGFYLGNGAGGCLTDSRAKAEYDFIANVLGYDEARGMIIAEQRNRFYSGEELEVLSADESFHNKILKADDVFDQNGDRVADCKIVQQKLYIKSGYKLKCCDMLRRRR